MSRQASLRAFVAALVVLPAALVAAQPPPRFHYPIPRIHRELPAEEVFGIQGYVVMMSECPPCPKDAVCATCELPYIVVSTQNQRLESPDRMTSREVRVQTNQLSGFVAGEHYRFVIRNASPGAGSQERLAFELLAFQLVPAGNPSLMRIDDPAIIAAVREVVQQRLGRDFFLDHLPANSTLENAVTYLASGSSSDIVLEAMTGVPTVYGLELETKHKQETVRILVFATRPDFRGELVYAVSRLDDTWPVFVTGNRKP